MIDFFYHSLNDGDSSVAVSIGLTKPNYHVCSTPVNAGNHLRMRRTLDDILLVDTDCVNPKLYRQSRMADLSKGVAKAGCDQKFLTFAKERMPKFV
jgi:hypothetical protein